MIDGIHDNLFWVDFVQHLIGERLDERSTNFSIDSPKHFRVPLDQLDAFVHTPKKLDSKAALFRSYQAIASSASWSASGANRAFTGNTFLTVPLFRTKAWRPMDSDDARACGDQVLVAELLSEESLPDWPQYFPKFLPRSEDAP